MKISRVLYFFLGSLLAGLLMASCGGGQIKSFGASVLDKLIGGTDSGSAPATAPASGGAANSGGDAATTGSSGGGAAGSPAGGSTTGAGTSSTGGDTAGSGSENPAGVPNWQWYCFGYLTDIDSNTVATIVYGETTDHKKYNYPVKDVTWDETAKDWKYTTEKNPVSNSYSSLVNFSPGFCIAQEAVHDSLKAHSVAGNYQSPEMNGLGDNIFKLPLMPGKNTILATATLDGKEIYSWTVPITWNPNGHQGNIDFFATISQPGDWGTGAQLHFIKPGNGSDGDCNPGAYCTLDSGYYALDWTTREGTPVLKGKPFPDASARMDSTAFLVDPASGSLKGVYTDNVWIIGTAGVDTADPDDPYRNKGNFLLCVKAVTDAGASKPSVTVFIKGEQKLNLSADLSADISNKMMWFVGYVSRDGQGGPVWTEKNIVGHDGSDGEHPSVCKDPDEI